MTATYLLGADSSERERMLFQGEMFRPEAELLLDRCGLGPGGRAVDVGCGPLGIMDLLSDRVGPAGQVVGVDGERRMLDMARQTATERGLGTVDLVLADAADTGLRRRSFDLAHTRLLLINVPHPDAVVGELVSLVRPGGMVAVQDMDWMSRVCEPGHPAWDRVAGAIAELWRRNGMDVFLGRKLPGMLRDAGVADVAVRAHTRVFGHEDPFQLLLVSHAEVLRDALADAGLITSDELDEQLAALRAHLRRPDTIVVHATLFQAWGRVIA